MLILKLSKRQSIWNFESNKDKNKKGKNTEKAEEITFTKVVSSATKEITNVELMFPVNEIDKSHGSPKENQKEIPDIWNIIIFVKYLKFKFIRTSVNN